MISIRAKAQSRSWPWQIHPPQTTDENRRPTDCWSLRRSPTGLVCNEGVPEQQENRASKRVKPQTQKSKSMVTIPQTVVKRQSLKLADFWPSCAVHKVPEGRGGLAGMFGDLDAVLLWCLGPRAPDPNWSQSPEECLCALLHPRRRHGRAAGCQITTHWHLRNDWLRALFGPSDHSEYPPPM